MPEPDSDAEFSGLGYSEICPAYSPDLYAFGASNLAFVKEVEAVFISLLEQIKERDSASHILKPMKSFLRSFVVEYSSFWKISAQEVDPDPHRRVVLSVRKGVAVNPGVHLSAALAAGLNEIENQIVVNETSLKGRKSGIPDEPVALRVVDCTFQNRSDLLPYLNLFLSNVQVMISRWTPGSTEGTHDAVVIPKVEGPTAGRKDGATEQLVAAAAFRSARAPLADLLVDLGKARDVVDDCWPTSKPSQKGVVQEKRIVSRPSSSSFGSYSALADA
jgi:hypothetical protein